jgi:hypothetical protein
MRDRFRITALFVMILVLVGTAVVVGPGLSNSAGAFGSVDSSVLGQKSVHEKITRTLGCAAGQAVANCLQPISIDVLAGRDGTFGAVGEPDDPLDGFPNASARHCDNVDYGYGSFQTLAEAQVSFDNCLEWFQSYLDFSVASAAGLLKADGTIDPAATDLINNFGSTYNACSFPDPKKGNTSNDSAKCNVLNGLGRALHAYEDVWSHSNWGDLADPAKAIGLENPTGLANTDQPWFMAYPGVRSATIPEGFLSGCDDSIPINDCSRGKSTVGDEIIGSHRTGHSAVNKDNGDVQPDSCIASNPLTVRGKVVVDGITNFSRAVTGACGAARRAWSDLQAALVTRYGSTAAALMIRAISMDHPLTECTVTGTAAKADSPPVGDRNSSRSVAIVVVNNTTSPLGCSTAVLDGGEWASYPPDATPAGASARWRTQSNGFATGTEGRVTLAVGSSSSTVTINWNNPYWGSNAYSCDATGGYRCTWSGGDGNDSTITVTISPG